jgi:hypothetical protein
MLGLILALGASITTIALMPWLVRKVLSLIGFIIKKAFLIITFPFRWTWFKLLDAIN